MIYRVVIVATGWYGTKTHTYSRDFANRSDAINYRGRETSTLGWRLRTAEILEIEDDA